MLAGLWWRGQRGGPPVNWPSLSSAGPPTVALEEEGEPAQQGVEEEDTEVTGF